MRAVLLAFAAIDDVFGLLVIAFAYTASVQPMFLGIAAAAYLGIIGLLISFYGFYVLYLGLPVMMK